LGGSEILESIVGKLPEKADIGEARFEGANAVVFTRSADFLFQAPEYLREVAKDLKLRIEARADSNLLLPIEEAEAIIRKMVGEAGITSIFFDTSRSIVIIEVEKPSLILGNGAEKLQELKKKIMWTPLIFRTPPPRKLTLTHFGSFPSLYIRIPTSWRNFALSLLFCVQIFLMVFITSDLSGGVLKIRGVHMIFFFNS